MGKTQEAERLKLQRYPCLKLLVGIIDPDQEHPLQHSIKAVCEKFGYPYKESTNQFAILNNKLITVFRKNNGIEHCVETIFEMPFIGLVSMLKTYYKYSYTTESGDTHSTTYMETAVLEINGRVIESREWDDDKCAELEGKMRSLVDNYNSPKNYMEYFFMAKDVFDRGNPSLDMFRDACRKIARGRGVDESIQKDWVQGLKDASKFIFDQYMQYLWGEEQENKDVQYRKGLNTFIKEHLPHWVKDEDYELRCYIYTEDHEKLTDTFLEEPDLHIVSSFFNFSLWNGWMKRHTDGTELGLEE